MPSLLPGYEYDIFISYRQKDNKYDGWVSEFVQNLKKELDATLKEEVSIYFDENPHDGLSETHQVEKSLGPKLKSLIFIPILSKTYCDPKSFAWNYEFLAFRDQAKQDPFGHEVKLRNGNVATRMLPVRIHELDANDMALFEQETGGVLRAVDFIFKSPGVNRPLRAKDDDLKEIQHAFFYRDQINKVANAVGEMLEVMTRQPDKGNGPQPRKIVPAGTAPTGKKVLAGTFAAFAVVLAVIGMLNYEEWFGENEGKSIAVLPFENLSPDPKDEYLASGFYEEVINQLSAQSELLVIQKSSSDQAARAGMSPFEMGQKLGVKFLLTGSVRREDDNLLISARLEEAVSGRVISSKTLERKLSGYFSLLKEVSNLVVRDVGLIVSEGTVQVPLTTNLRAFELLREARAYNYQSPDTATRNKHFSLIEASLREDSMFQAAWFNLVNEYLFFYGNQGDSVMLRKALEAKSKIESIDPSGVVAQSAGLLYSYWVLEDYDLTIRQADKMLKAQPFYFWARYRKGFAMRRKGDRQGFLDNHIALLRLSPLATGLKGDIALELVNRGQSADVRNYFTGLRQSGANNYTYYTIAFNCLIVEGKVASLDSLVHAAEGEEGHGLTRNEIANLRSAVSGFTSFYKRDYAKALEAWPAMGAYDSAILYSLMGDSAMRAKCFNKAKADIQMQLAQIRNVQVAKRMKSLFGVVQAALGESNWNQTFEQASDNLDGIGLPELRNRYLMACILAGEHEEAFEVLKKRESEDIGYGVGINEFFGPRFLCLRDHPLLDPLRAMPGFDDLWEGNHLKVKKLRVPGGVTARLLITIFDNALPHIGFRV